MSDERGFKMVTEFEASGDQPRAIGELSEGIARGDKYQTLLGGTVAPLHPGSEPHRAQHCAR